MAAHPAALRLPRHACRALIRGQPPPSVAGLSSLQRACFLPFHGGPHWQPTAPLPLGPWAASLRQLFTDFETLLFSSELLAAAGQLEQVGVLGGDLGAERNAASERFWRWCFRHQPLRQLHIEMETLALPGVGSHFVGAVNAMHGMRPELQVHCQAESGVVLFSPSVRAFQHHV